MLEFFWCEREYTGSGEVWQWERTDNSPRRSTRPEIMEFGASITYRKARTEPEH